MYCVYDLLNTHTSPFTGGQGRGPATWLMGCRHTQETWLHNTCVSVCVCVQ